MRVSKTFAEPLDILAFQFDGPAAHIEARDGAGQIYARIPATADASIQISGALGAHTFFLLDEDARILDSVVCKVDCETFVKDQGGIIEELLSNLRFTLESWLDGVGNDFTSRVDGKTYRYFVCWLRDHVHTMKGQKYFYPGELKTAIELYADTQRADGMIYDRIGSAHANPTWRDYTFREGDFIKPLANGKYRMERIPVENDVEFLFLEGLYYTWKACGDDQWMIGLLDNAIKAVHYAMNDRYRWSEQFQLLKRGYTIDTWDFMHSDDTRLTTGNNIVDIDKTTFGVMFGDNTGMAVGLDYLSEMLQVANRDEEAAAYKQAATDMRKRLHDVAWNGEFYTHHVSEDPSFKREFGGTDPSRQVSLSNAYSLNRRIGHDKCTAIIKSYQRIREEMPATSPGEFYQIYPPFEHGFGNENGKWHYMNGGVGTIVAGELAHGAFEHGSEAYGFDILQRVHGWSKQYDGYLPVALRGCAEDVVNRQFESIDISAYANTDFVGDGEAVKGVMQWTGEGGNDLANMPCGAQEFESVPFDVIDPASNNRRAAIGLSRASGYYDELTIEVHKRAQSLYFLHTLAGGALAGWLTYNYANGERSVIYINDGQQVRSWFMPPANWKSQRGHSNISTKLAWWGPNKVFDSVGVYVWGCDNPNPDLEIASLTFTAAENNNKWFILGISACDQAVVFPSDGTSFGIPDCWGSSAVVYAIIEGLAGVKDTGVAMSTATVAPRWAATGIQQADVCVKYPSSSGYVRYQYNYNAEGSEIIIKLASSAVKQSLRILLPESTTVDRVLVNNEEHASELNTIESSQYLYVTLEKPSAYEIQLQLK